MSDDETTADSGGALSADHDDMTWIEWQPMDAYQDKQVVLTQGGGRQLFGFRQDGVWNEMIGGDEVPVAGYEPTAWTAVPRGKWANWAVG